MEGVTDDGIDIPNPPSSDTVTLITNYDASFPTSISLLRCHSGLFRDMLEDKSAVEEPIIIPPATAHGLALVLALIDVDNRLDFVPTSQGLFNALELADFLDMPIILDRLKDEASRPHTSISDVSFTRNLYAAALEEEGLVRRRAWETLPLGMESLPEIIRKDLTLHLPIYLHRLQHFHLLYGRVWFSLRQSLLFYTPNITDLAKWSLHCVPALDIRSIGSGCTLYQKHCGDFNRLRASAADILIMSALWRTWDVYLRNDTMIRLLMLHLNCYDCCQKLGKLFQVSIKQHEGRSKAPKPLPPAWFIPVSVGMRKWLTR